MRVRSASVNFFHGQFTPCTRQERAWRAERERAWASPLTTDDVEAMIAAALSAERATVLPTLAELISEQFDAQRERYNSELLERTRSLELTIARLEASVSALQLELNIERSKTIDLPPLLPRMVQ
jgi:hypothetical protein